MVWEGEAPAELTRQWFGRSLSLPKDELPWSKQRQHGYRGGLARTDCDSRSWPPARRNNRFTKIVRKITRYAISLRLGFLVPRRHAYVRLLRSPWLDWARTEEQTDPETQVPEAVVGPPPSATRRAAAPGRNAPATATNHATSVYCTIHMGSQTPTTRFL